MYALPEPSNVHESDGAAEGINLGLHVRDSPKAVVEMVEWLGLAVVAVVQGVANVFDALACRRARPHPPVFGVRKGAGIEVKIEGRGFAIVDVFVVNAFEEGVVRHMVHLLAFPSSSGLEFQFVALRSCKRGVGGRGCGGVGLGGRGGRDGGRHIRWGGNRVGWRRVCEPEWGDVLGVILGLIHQARAVLLEQLLLEVLPNVEVNGRGDGAADSEVKCRELFAGSKGALA
jgi:hypothetical protein